MSGTSPRLIAGGLFAMAIVFCHLPGPSAGPIAKRDTSISDPHSCTVCIRRAPNYVVHTNIQWSAGGRICVRKTFSRHDDWLTDCEERSGGKAVELVELTSVPSCEVCHENSSLVEAWHKSWTAEDGGQCASAEYVPKS